MSRKVTENLSFDRYAMKLSTQSLFTIQNATEHIAKRHEKWIKIEVPTSVDQTDKQAKPLPFTEHWPDVTPIPTKT